MFETLVSELSRIRTKNFHIIREDAPPLNNVDSSQQQLPASYVRFVLQFGNAKLYRYGSTYQIEVFATPVSSLSADGVQLLQFGRTSAAPVYFKAGFPKESNASPVFGWNPDEGLHQISPSFEEWFEHEAARSRAQYSEQEWRSIEAGPSPFSIEEQRIIKARRAYRWRVIGISPNGDIQFEVQNGSEITLPYLTVAIEGTVRPPRIGSLKGAAWLPVGDIPPGETKVVEKACYKELIDPKEIRATAKPDPEPEDRDRYWEFRADAPHSTS